MKVILLSVLLLIVCCSTTTNDKLFPIVAETARLSFGIGYKTAYTNMQYNKSMLDNYNDNWKQDSIKFEKVILTLQ
ncbi:MAG: hypothetical protein M0R17_08140 [Candidatus Omnitrophica bacterium]|jgi:hypothetical protein|nr:hypothetical protein [Candidatus Omnitrophota bacterium]